MVRATFILARLKPLAFEDVAEGRGRFFDVEEAMWG